MTASSAGNVRLRAARQERGLASQRAFVDALVSAGRRAGLGELSLSTRTVRRWEAENPSWPRPHYTQALEALFGTTMENLGFTRPPSAARPEPANDRRPGQPLEPLMDVAAPLRFSGSLDDEIVGGYGALTTAYRQLYGPLPGSALDPSATQHARLGSRLLTSPSIEHHRALAQSVCDACLLVARIRLFDTHDLPGARAYLHHALAAAHTAEDDARAAAALAHSALAAAVPHPPAYGQTPQELIRVARTFAARCTEDAPLLRAWLDMAEADIELRTGDPAAAAALVAHAERLCNEGAEPQWLDWLHPNQVATMKADVLLSLGRDTEAMSVLQRVTRNEAASPKHRALAHADLAAIAAAQQDPQSACQHLRDALDALDGSWHGAVDARVRQARNHLEPWNESPDVCTLDQHLYTWTTALGVTAQ